MGRDVQLADLKRVIQILPGGLTGEDYRKWLIMKYLLITLFGQRQHPLWVGYKIGTFLFHKIVEKIMEKQLQTILKKYKFAT